MIKVHPGTFVLAPWLTELTPAIYLLKHQLETIENWEGEKNQERNKDVSDSNSVSNYLFLHSTK